MVQRHQQAGSVLTTQLVTGGAGFIGSHLVRRLVSDGARVRIVDDLSTGSLERLADVRAEIDLIEADLAVADLGRILRGVDRVFHLAAVPSVPRSVKDPFKSHTSVVTATLRLLIAARDVGVRRLVLSSSSSVYGNSEVSPKHEGMPPRPLSPYAVAKSAAEGYARVFSGLYGLRTVALRYFNVFGPGQDPVSAYAAVIPRFIRSALASEPLTVYGDGSQTRDFTYVDNVVDANLRAADADAPVGAVFNVAAGQPHTVNELVAMLQEIIGRPVTVTHAEARPGDIVHSHANIDAARHHLGWSPTVDLREGLRRTVEWYRRP